MVRTLARHQDRDMTQTPEQSPVNTEHLRDYTALRRSVTDRKIAGVAGGLGRHLNIDPTVIRVVLVVLCFFGGAGFLLYAAAWLLVPEEGKQEALIGVSASARNTVLIVVGVVAALLLVGDSWGGFGFPWPLVLIGLAVLIYLTLRERNMNTTQNTGSAPPGPAAPGTPPDPAADGSTGPASEPTAADHEPTVSYGAPPPWAPPPAPPYQPPAPQKTGPRLFWVTVALSAIALGVLGMFDVAGLPVADAAYPALALTVVGAMLLVGAWYGRAGGLVALGVVTALVLAAVSVGEPRFDGARNVRFAPTSAVQVEDRYHLPAGAIELDLSNVRDIEGLDGRSIEVESNAGELRVTVPDGVDAIVNAEIRGAGEADVDGQRVGGTDVDITRTIDGGADAPEIELDLRLVVGSIEVNQS
jgi:phage shock protein PspC (stress-responsive transcriptional regulator)